MELYAHKINPMLTLFYVLMMISRLRYPEVFDASAVAKRHSDKVKKEKKKEKKDIRRMCFCEEYEFSLLHAPSFRAYD